MYGWVGCSYCGCCNSVPISSVQNLDEIAMVRPQLTDSRPGTGITFFSRFWAASMMESVSQGVRLSRMSLSQIGSSSSGINIPASSCLLWYPSTKIGSSLLTCFIGFLCRLFNIRTLTTARLNGGIGRNR